MAFLVFKPCEYYNLSIVNQTYKTSIITFLLSL